MPEAIIIPGVLIRSLGIKRVSYTPNPGNAGDALIAAATFQHFAAHGIECVNSEGKYGEQGIQGLCFGGGGNLVPGYMDAARWLEDARTIGLPVILLPHSIVGHERLLESMGKHTHILCRDRVSYENAKARCQSANVYLAHDMAFSLDVEKLLKDYPRAIRTLLATERAAEVLRKLVKCQLVRSLGNVTPPFFLNKKELVVLRTDGESATNSGTCDISQLFAVDRINETTSIFSAGLLVRALMPYGCVRTDRLHVSIAAALLGKRVGLLPNSYFKNMAVYDFSMCGSFPNVVWEGKGRCADT